VAEARRIALVVIALLEGAFILCRATKSTEPMRAAGQAAVAVLRGALLFHDDGPTASSAVPAQPPAGGSLCHPETKWALRECHDAELSAG
jgi:hypothetical protein